MVGTGEPCKTEGVGKGLFSAKRIGDGLGRATTRSRLVCCGALLSCGGSDVTTFTGSAGAAPAGEGSRILAVLGEPESLDAVCRLIGVSTQGAAALGGGSAESCARVVEQCRATAGEVFGLRQTSATPEAAAPAGSSTAAAAAPPADLQGLLGCPVTFTELDGCVAQMLERGRDQYAGEVSCESTSLPAIDAAFLVTVPACFVVVLRCPQLLTFGELLESMP